MPRRYIALDEFMKGAQPTRLDEEVKAKLNEERRGQLIDQDTKRSLEDWSYLLSKPL